MSGDDPARSVPPGPPTGHPGTEAGKRCHRRAGSAPPLRVVDLPAAVHDVSRGGVCLALRIPMRPGERHRLVLEDLLDGSRREIEAEVVWCRDGRAGLRWIDLAPETDRWLLQRFQVWLAALEGASRR